MDEPAVELLLSLDAADELSVESSEELSVELSVLESSDDVLVSSDDLPDESDVAVLADCVVSAVFGLEDDPI